MTTIDQKITGHYIGGITANPEHEKIIEVYSSLDGSSIGAVPSASQQTS